jgi:hypothetical protein
LAAAGLDVFEHELNTNRDYFGIANDGIDLIFGHVITCELPLPCALPSQPANAGWSHLPYRSEEG